MRTVTTDNGTEFHRYAASEAVTQAHFYFATRHHAWELGTNENTNGLIRQDCTAIARKLNERPRNRLGYRSPEECCGR